MKNSILRPLYKIGTLRTRHRSSLEDCVNCGPSDRPSIANPAITSDILLLVFSFLDESERRDAIRTASRVCRGLHTAAKSILYANVKLSHPVSIALFVRTLQQYPHDGSFVRHLHLETPNYARDRRKMAQSRFMWPGTAEGVVQEVLTACPNILTLCINIPGLANTNTPLDVSTRIYSLHTVLLGKTTSKIADAITQGTFPNMETLIVYGLSWLRPLSPSFPNLRKMKIVNIETQQTFDLLFPFVTSRLRELEISSCQIPPPSSEWPASSGLQSLVFHNLSLTDSAALGLLRCFSSNITSLKMRMTTFPNTDEPFGWPSFPTLQDLHIIIVPQNVLEKIIPGYAALANMLTVVSQTLRHLEISGLRASLSADVIFRFPSLVNLRYLSLVDHFDRKQNHRLHIFLRAIFVGLPPKLRQLRLNGHRGRPLPPSTLFVNWIGKKSCHRFEEGENAEGERWITLWFGAE